MKKTPLFCIFLGMILAGSINAIAQSIDDVVSVEISASRDKVYLNEMFQLMLSITSTGIRIDQNPQLIPASMPDKTRLDWSNFGSELAPERTLQGNQIREKRRFTSNARAISAGAMQISPVLRIGIVSGSGFFTQISQFDIKSKNLSLPVLPLPETGKPAGFSGAVGEFSLDVEAAPADAAVGDLITVTTRISGKGYLDPAYTLNISPGSNFKAYPARNIQDMEQGGKMFEQILVPQNTNAVAIPAVSFCFFNPSNSIYQTVSKGPFKITFHPQKKAAIEAIYRPSEQRLSSSRSILQDKITAIQDSFNIRIMMITVYWIIVVVVSLWITLKRTRGSLIAVGIILLASIMFLPLMNLANRYLAGGTEAVLIRNENARFAPAYSAVPSFAVPRTSQVRVLETFGTWSKIEITGKKAWIPADAMTNSSTGN